MYFYGDMYNIYMSKYYFGILFVLSLVITPNFVLVKAVDGCDSTTKYSTVTGQLCPVVAVNVTADLKINGEDDFVVVSLGDVLKVTWTSNGASGCQVYSQLDKFKVNGVEWIGTLLPPSGSVDLTVSKWSNADHNGMELLCFSGVPGYWGSFSELDSVSLADKFVTNAKVVHPTIAKIFPSSGPVGTKITITGSGFTNNNVVTFIGSTNYNSETNNTVSPIDGEKDFINLPSTDGKSLTFTIPSSFMSEVNTNNPVSIVPGVYYLLVSVNGEKSNVIYFKVTDNAQDSNFISPKTSISFPRLLIQGFSGQDVKRLQKMLGVNPTAFFGKITLQKVKEFQKKYGLKDDGKIGPQTALKLEEIFRN